MINPIATQIAPERNLGVLLMPSRKRGSVKKRPSTTKAQPQKVTKTPKAIAIVRKSKNVGARSGDTVVSRFAFTTGAGAGAGRGAGMSSTSTVGSLVVGSLVVLLPLPLALPLRSFFFFASFVVDDGGAVVVRSFKASSSKPNASKNKNEQKCKYVATDNYHQFQLPSVHPAIQDHHRLVR
jgi:hypothetical protein